jgi:hypothetical protein
MTFVGFVSRHPVLYFQKVMLDLLPSIGVYLEAVYYSYVPFLLLGLFLVLRGKFWLHQDLLLLMFLVFYLIGFALIFVNLRYSVQLVPVSLGWTGLGVAWCWNRLERAYPARHFRIIALAAMVIFLAGTLPKTLKAISPEKAHVREAGRYLKTLNRSGNLTVFVFDDRITFYGDAKPILLGELDEAKLVEKIRRHEGAYVATDLKPWQHHYPKIARNPEVYGLTIDREFPVVDKDRLVIFKVS